jgi:alkanesulfonate monooxygenase SsuD/methylene tetrahydromethanopterin reductase-like flavin-dependent oxidoreductase (luciferase family)
MFFPAQYESHTRLYDEVFEQAQLAEQLGFEAFFVPEHHQMPDGYMPAPLTFTAALAAKTQRAEIGASIMQLPLFHPLHVAKQIAVIDNLSKGRFILGAGLGLVQKEFDAFQIPLADAASHFTESVEILKQAWTGQPFSFQGRHFQFTNVTIPPKPVRRPRPPIWIGAMSEITLKRAGRIADGSALTSLRNIRKNTMLTTSLCGSVYLDDPSMGAYQTVLDYLAKRCCRRFRNDRKQHACNGY